MIKTFAEWERQEALIVSLPHEKTDWKPYLKEILASYKEFVKTAATFQKVIIIAPSFADFLPFSNLENVEFCQAQTNDTWVRDYGALDFKEDGKVKSYDFRFNAWGGKFESALDDSVNEKMFSEFFDEELTSVDLILEGGSVEFNGEGVMLTTTECLLNANRNGLSKEALESELKELFGLSRIVWLENGFVRGDDTDSHIDTLARFISPTCVAVASMRDEKDEHFLPLKKMREEVVSAGFDVVELPLPREVKFEGRRLGATYCNFVFVNGGLIVPTYGDKESDDYALGVLQRALPHLKVVGVDARVFVRQNGSLHCSCQNRFARE